MVTSLCHLRSSTFKSKRMSHHPSHIDPESVHTSAASSRFRSPANLNVQVSSVWSDTITDTQNSLHWYVLPYLNAVGTSQALWVSSNLQSCSIINWNPFQSSVLFVPLRIPFPRGSKIPRPSSDSMSYVKPLLKLQNGNGERNHRLKPTCRVGSQVSTPTHR